MRTNLNQPQIERRARARGGHAPARRRVEANRIERREAARRSDLRFWWTLLVLAFCAAL